MTETTERTSLDVDRMGLHLIRLKRELEDCLQERTVLLAQLFELRREAELHIAELRLRTEEIAELQGRDAHLGELNLVVEELNTNLAKRDQRIGELNRIVEGLNTNLGIRDGRIGELNAIINDLGATLETGTGRIADLSRMIEEQKGTITDHQNAIAALQAAITHGEAEIQAIHLSTSWRLTAPLRMAKRSWPAARRTAAMWLRAIDLVAPLPARLKMLFKGWSFALLSPLLADTDSYRAWEAYQRARPVTQPLEWWGPLRPIFAEWARALYLAAPLPMSLKMRIKGALFALFSPLLRTTNSYRAWLTFEQARQGGSPVPPTVIAHHASDVHTLAAQPGQQIAEPQQKPESLSSHGNRFESLRRERAIRKSLAIIHPHCLEYGPITHMILVPFLGRGGAEKVALNFCRAVLERQPGTSVLLVMTDGALFDAATQLPDGGMVLVLDTIEPNAQAAEKQRLLFDLILAIRPQITHNINSEMGWVLICNNGQRLREFTKLYGSIFCFQSDSHGTRIGYAASFFAKALPFLECMLSDNHRFLDEAAREYHVPEADRERLRVVYNPVRIVLSEDRVAHALDRLKTFAAQPAPLRKLKVLWAGRLDAQKRLDLLFEVIRECHFADFHVFGKAVVDGDGNLPEIPNLFYRGAFESPEDLVATDRYDAFVFTTREEGMPNMLLEIGALGIPVIAPDIGGIRELVCATTGYLLPAAVTAVDYRNALLQIRQHPAQAATKSLALLESISQRHSWSRFAEEVRALPGYLV